MPKHIVPAGSELTFKSDSLLIRPLANKGSPNPKVLIYRADGSELSPDLSVGRVKISHSKRGYRKLVNAGSNDVEIEIPAPAHPNDPVLQDDDDV